jgi:hypothetical protein
MKTDVMWAWLWNTSDCEKVKTDQASGPLATTKKIWNRRAEAGFAHR